MIFNWFKSEQRERRKKVRLDRKHLEMRSRRFLKNYLNADASAKPQFYRAVEDISTQCQPAWLGLAQTDLEDGRIAEVTAEAAMQMVLKRNARVNKEDDEGFLTDACATVAVAYHRAAGVYKMDNEMQELGTAAVHLLTMATSYIKAQTDNEGIATEVSS